MYGYNAATDPTGSDVTDAMAWSVNPTAPTATITPYLQGVPTQVAVPAILTDIPAQTVGQPWSTIRGCPVRDALRGQSGLPLCPGERPAASGFRLVWQHHGADGRTPTTPGTYSFTLKATDAAGAVGTRAYTVVVNPAAARLQFVQEPTDTVAGQIIDAGTGITVQLLNSLGLPLNNTGTPVTISLYSGTGKLLGTLTQTTINGVATFSDAQINIVGVKVLKTTTGSGSRLISTTSDPFNITAAPASQLVFVQQPGTRLSTRSSTPPPAASWCRSRTRSATRSPRRGPRSP